MQCGVVGDSSKWQTGWRWGGGGGRAGVTPEGSRAGCLQQRHLCCVPSHQVVWRYMVTQAVCQALRGKKDFPVLGAGLASCETPTCRSVAYTFLAEGRLCQATYEGEWCRGRPHGK